MKAIDIYRQSDGDVTTAYYNELKKRGDVGLIALNLFRAQKCSSRAKGYGRGRRQAYDRKGLSIDNLTAMLKLRAAELGIAYGWKQDPDVLFGDRPSWVLYIDLPQGQVSFHSPSRGDGPDYAGEWDGMRDASVGRILRYCDEAFALAPVVAVPQ